MVCYRHVTEQMSDEKFFVNRKTVYGELSGRIGGNVFALGVRRVFGESSVYTDQT